MKLRIKNIGPFVDSQEIVIDGITILGGLNGTGKSTFGKVLYCFFSAFKDIESKVEEDRKKTIQRIIWDGIRDNSKDMRKLTSIIAEFAYDAVHCNDPLKLNELKKNVIDEIKSEIDYPVSSDVLNKKIQEVLDLDDNIIRGKILENHIEAEFGYQVKNVNSKDENASAELIIKNRRLLFSYRNETASVIDYISLNKNVIYFDDPNVVNDSFGSNILSVFGVNNHKTDLIEKLQTTNKENLSSVEQILIQKRIKNIEDKLNKICEGDISLNESNQFLYKSEKYKDGLNILNVATGLKSFAILKKLLKKGYLEDNGVIIFDEPEIHLHPQWQRAWAEVIVLLNKEFGMHILISTHSSEFLNFLELFTYKYEVHDKTRLYSLKQNSLGKSSVKDVSKNWDVVYKQLGNPFISATEELDAFNNDK